jgi:hypothetical protein
MPFRSERQRRYLWARKPELAKKWTESYGSKIQPTSPREKLIRHISGKDKR